MKHLLLHLMMVVVGVASQLVMLYPPGALLLASSLSIAL